MIKTMTGADAHSHTDWRYLQAIIILSRVLRWVFARAYRQNQSLNRTTCWNFRGEHPPIFGLCLLLFSQQNTNFGSDLSCRQIFCVKFELGKQKVVKNVKLWVWWTHFVRPTLPWETYPPLLLYLEERPRWQHL